jgi:hypothetical protein
MLGEDGVECAAMKQSEQCNARLQANAVKEGKQLKSISNNIYSNRVNNVFKDCIT